MKPLFCFLSLLGFACLSVADDFDDFRVPAHSVARTSLEFNLSGYRNRDGTDIPGDYSKRLQQNGSLLLNHLWRAESDRRLIVFGPWIRETEGVNSTKYRDQNESDPSYTKYESSVYDFSSQVGLSGTYALYLLSDRVGIDVDGMAQVSHRQSGGESSGYRLARQSQNGPYYQQWDESKSEHWGQSYDFEVTVGPTFGRIRNVTPVGDALVMEQRLIKEGALKAPLSAENRRALAELLYKRPTYSYLYDRWNKNFWSDVEQILSSDPAYAGELSTYSTHRITEGYFGSLYRQSGLAISPSVRYDHTNYIDHNWNRTSSRQDLDSMQVYDYEDYNRYHSHNDQTSYGLRADYAEPFGPNWQLDAWCDVFYDPEFFQYYYASDSRERNWATELGSRLSWLIADRWNGAGFVRLNGYFVDEVGDLTYRQHELNSTLAFHLGHQIENHIELSANISDTYRWSHSRFSNGENYTRYSRSDRRESAFYLSLTYALQGALYGYSNNYPIPLSHSEIR